MKCHSQTYMSWSGALACTHAKLHMSTTYTQADSNYHCSGSTDKETASLWEKYVLWNRGLSFKNKKQQKKTLNDEISCLLIPYFFNIALGKNWEWISSESDMVLLSCLVFCFAVQSVGMDVVEMDKGKTNVQGMKREMTTGMRKMGKKTQRGTDRKISMIRNKRTATVWRTEWGEGGTRELCFYWLQLERRPTRIQTGVARRRGKKGCLSTLVCWLHRIVISEAPPPTTLTPVAERNVNSCMTGGQNCMRGQRGEVRVGVHF